MNFIKKCFYSVLTVCFCCFQLSSQDIIYEHYRYGVEEGLPSSEVYEILQDRKGYIWFCTDAGVSRFNGYEFENFYASDGLTTNSVFHLYEDFKGRIWFLPYNGQLCYYDKGSIYPYKFNNKLKEAIPEKWIRSIAVDSNETVHFTGIRYTYGSIDKYGKLDYQFYSHSDTGIISYYQKDQDFFVYGLKPNIESAFDIFTDNDQKCIIDYHNIYASIAMICQHQLSNNEFLFFVGDKLCFKFKDGLKTLRFKKHIQSIYVDSKKQVWLSFINSGIKIYKNIDAIFLDEKPIKHLFTDKNISSTYEDNSNGIWLAVQNGGAYYIPNLNIEVYKLNNNELTNRVSAIHKSNNNAIYAGTFNSQIYQVFENRVSKLLFKNVLTNNGSIYDFSIGVNYKGNLYPIFIKETKTRDGSTWVEGYHYFYKIKNGKIIFSSDRILDEVRTSRIYEDLDGRIWISGNNHIYIYEQDSLYLITKQSELFQKRITKINQLSNGIMLGTTAGNGLLMWRGIGENVVIITKKNGLPSNIIRDIYIDKDEEVWLSTPKGVSRIVINSDGDYTVFNITTKHGLPSNEINQITSVNNITWVATNKGLAKFDKQKVKKNNITPWVYIDKVVINEKIMPVQLSYNLEYDQNFIEFDFIGLSYKENGNVRYRYCMQGIDKNWIETKTRFARYPLLPNGDYTFQIQAANEDGVWSNPKSISIKINPPYWKTIWFTTFCLIAFILLLVFVFRQREIRHRKEMTAKKILEREKLQTIRAELKALRAQMNPHFTFNTLSAIQNAVNNSDKENASKYIGDFAKLIRKVLENSKRAFITLREELEMLKLYIELEQLRFGKKFAFEIIVDENLDIDFHEIPTMIIQPFIENAILHGLAPKKAKVGLLIVSIQLNNKVILCTIEDNGVGRDKALEIKKRNGFARVSMATEITEDRIKLYKKEIKENFSVKIIDLKDRLDNAKGTRIELTFPV